MDIIELIDYWTSRVTAIAWALFLLTWSIGWAIKGSPIPSSKIKKVGMSMVEDAVWAAFWLALGSTVFKAIVVLVDTVTAAIFGGG